MSCEWKNDFLIGHNSSKLLWATLIRLQEVSIKIFLVWDECGLGAVSFFYFTWLSWQLHKRTVWPNNGNPLWSVIWGINPSNDFCFPTFSKSGSSHPVLMMKHRNKPEGSHQLFFVVHEFSTIVSIFDHSIFLHPATT